MIANCILKLVMIKLKRIVGDCMSSLYFPLASLLISTMITIVFFAKKRQTNSETNLYSTMLILNIIEVITAISIIIISKTLGTINLLYLLNRLDFILITTWCSCLFSYVYGLSSHKHTKKTKKLLKIINAVFVITLLIADFSIINKPESIDTAGLAPALVGIYCAFYAIGMIASLVITIFFKKEELRINKYYPIFVFVCLIGLSLLLRSVWPTMVLEPFMISFINLIMYHTIENPDMKMIEQLENARNQAEKANRAKTDFLSSMSHEIRTPLNAIVGFSDYIMTSDSLDDAKENAKDIINASNTLLEIVNSILDISKIEAGKLEIINSKYEAKSMFESLAKLITPKMKEKGLDFTYYIAPDIPDTLYGDPANIKKIVTNILSNAYKYTDKGFVRYEVNCINNPPLTKLIISVEDSGRGIKQEKIDKLFTKFQRLDEDRNTTIEGTGLGLAITKQLTELMGGKILVHTKYGEGSKFTIILSQKIENTKVKEKKQELKTTLDLTDKKILIVDDNELNLKVASKVLQRYNANNIETLDNGFACIEKIKSNEKYDVILLDDMMPKMGGIETLKKLKELPNFKIPVVALTANAISGMKEKYLNEDFDAYLAKPIEKDELIKVMNQLLFKEDNLEKTEILEIVDEEAIKEYEEQKEDPKKKIKETLIDSLKEQTPVIEANELYLQENGVNLAISLEILGDMEMYNETIKDFVDLAKTKLEKIKFYKKQQDLENYAIEVHSLKSDAQHLGFIDLAELAYQQEIKSKSKDTNFIDKYFSTLEDECLRVLEVAKRYTDSLK